MTAVELMSTERQRAASFLELTVCHHGDQEFYTLGRIELEVPAEVLLAQLPKTPPHDCEAAEWCLILDYWPDEQTGISDDREITQEMTDQLLAGEFASRLQAAREDLAALYLTFRAAS